MENSKFYPLALEALVELAPEIAAAQTFHRAAPLRPSLDRVLTEIGELPEGALFLGMAEDGLPVLLNLYDPAPGPILVIGEEGAGKTILLKSIANIISKLYQAEDVQFSSVTLAPDEWDGMEHLPHCAGVAGINETSAGEMITSLYEWAHENQQSQQVVIFLLDGFGLSQEWNETVKSHLRWLLMRGPSRRIWPVLTVNSNLLGDIKEWLSLFRILIYGRISNTALADVLTSASRAKLDSLQPGEEFSMKEGDHWLRFWIPQS